MKQANIQHSYASTPSTVNRSVQKIAFSGIFAAITFVVFTYLSIPIPTIGGSKVTVHLGNAFCILGVLLLGSFYGSIGGAIGLTIGDLLDPVYIVQAPITFILKFVMGLIAGAVAHRLLHINKEENRRGLTGKVALASVCGLAFNAIFDPLVRYYYKIWILGKAAAEVSLSINIVVTLINSIVSLFVVVALYMVLRPSLKKAGFTL